MNRKEKFALCVVVVFKVVIVIFAINYINSGEAELAGFISTTGGDAFSYVDPIENLFKHGVYAQDLTRLVTYAGRMPGYGVVYGILRLMLAPAAASDGVVVVQFLVGIGSTYCLARLAQLVTRKQEAFYWTLLFYLIHVKTILFDLALLTESLTTSSAIIGVYFLCKAHYQKSNKLFLLAGLMLAWMVFLRPFTAPLFILLIGFYSLSQLLTFKSLKIRYAKPAAIGFMLLSFPFLIADGAWMMRNWFWYHRAVPLQVDAWAGYKTAPGLKQLTSFIGAIGEEPVWWYKPNDIAWFYKPESEPATNFQGREGVFAPPVYTYDSLLLVRRNLLLATDAAKPLMLRQMAEARATRALATYEQAYKRLRPVHAFVVVPIKLMYRLTLAHASDYFFQQTFAELSIFNKIIKIFIHVSYLVIVLAGLIGVFAVGWNNRPETVLVKLVPLYIIILLCVVMHQVEARYFAPAYPFVVINSVVVLLKTKSFLQSRFGVSASDS